MKKDYVCVMEYTTGDKHWYWYIRSYNGHVITINEWYKNKSQCRNVGKRFADKMGLEWREE